MQSMSAKDAKYGFGRLIDLARSEPVTVDKHGRPVVVVMAVVENERLRDSASAAAPVAERKRAVLEDQFKALLHRLMTGEIIVADLDLSALGPQPAADAA